MGLIQRFQVYRTIYQSGVMPIFNHPDLEKSYEIIRLCVKAGLRVFEWTHRGPEAFSNFVELQQRLVVECPDLLFGVGSILDAETASHYQIHGAKFVVSPILSESLALFCNRHKLAWLPGCGSLSEMHRAHELGAEFVKLFPASHMNGPRFLKSIRGPMKNIAAVPTGGIAPTAESMQPWLEAGAVCVGLGSSLFFSDGVLSPYTEIERRIRDALDIVATFRSE